MTFPLMLDHLRQNPNTPLWVVAHPQFYNTLSGLAPSASFYPVSSLPDLQKGKYSAIINLSSQPEAALFTHNAQAALKLGLTGEPGNLHINGFWQLYRAALTANNRHNLFHWADLFRMDRAFPLKNFTIQRPQKKRSGRVALFLGASEQTKRPDAEFWISCARRLIKAGFMPVLLGGPGEKAFGEEVAARTGLPSFCGKTTLLQLASLIKNSDLLITPDTGPMHLADWLGTPVLNLSLGNVSPWETGPISPGQWILQANISCSGCWSCTRGRQYCRAHFSAAGAANIALNILKGQEIPEQPGLLVFQTGRDQNGLYNLKDIHKKKSSLNSSLGQFWQAAFLYFAGYAPLAGISEAAKRIAGQNPALIKNLLASQRRLLEIFLTASKSGSSLQEDFWRRFPSHTSLFAGYCQMTLQNEDYGKQSWNKILAQTSALKEKISQIL